MVLFVCINKSSVELELVNSGEDLIHHTENACRRSKKYLIFSCVPLWVHVSSENVILETSAEAPQWCLSFICVQILTVWWCCTCEKNSHKTLQGCSWAAWEVVGPKMWLWSHLLHCKNYCIVLSEHCMSRSLTHLSTDADFEMCADNTPDHPSPAWFGRWNKVNNLTCIHGSTNYAP